MKVVIRLDAHVSFKYKKLKARSKSCWSDLKEEFTHTNPQYVRNERIGIPNTNEPEIYFSYNLKKSRVYFSRGGLKKIKRILRRYGHEVKVIDKRVVGDAIDFKSRSNIKLRDIQKKPNKIAKKKRNGIIKGPCSVGKSVIGLKFIEDCGRRGLVVVWSKVHQEQWIAEATNKNLLNLDPRDIGGVGGKFKKRKLGKLNVCMQQSLWNEDHQEFFFPHCGTVVCDEIQRFAARTCHETIDACPARNRLGVTADEKRKDGKEFFDSRHIR